MKKINKVTFDYKKEKLITYKTLKKEFEGKLEKLQKECKHKKYKWMDQWFAPGHSTGHIVKVCLRCDKILEEKDGLERNSRNNI